ncbi:MORN repeat-containing protein 4 isoform X2 [Dermochelys coriacea]|uniref:MORN repeat-containing protein 4 isoform X2 n=1 Tax=Dermochelys coriacea TaxID=27794 RepID=UPI001CAA00BF|nr:MORN repeat-containing protein 4 isoform X2 [Dermochelys coriacea]
MRSRVATGCHGNSQWHVEMESSDAARDAGGPGVREAGLPAALTAVDGDRDPQGGAAPVVKRGVQLWVMNSSVVSGFCVSPHEAIQTSASLCPIPIPASPRPLLQADGGPVSPRRALAVNDLSREHSVQLPAWH